MAWDDPNWGKKKNGRPPDLDELWQKFVQKLNQLFGRKGGGPIPSAGGGRLSSGGRNSARIFIILLLVVWLGSGFYIVNAGERGVVLRFGKFVEATEPGPRWHIPYPIEIKEIVNMEAVRTVPVGYRDSVKNKILKESLMLTDDENIIDLQFTVQYTLQDPEDYLFNNRDPDEAVRQAAETAIREIVGKNQMDYVLYEGRTEVAINAEKLMQEVLDRYQTGISISQVTMQNAQPPEQVQAAFDDAVKAGQDKERQKNEGQAYANDVIPKARGLASRLIAEANGYKQRVIAAAEGDASRFRQILVEYEKAPGVTRDRLYLDAMQDILSSTTKVMVDQKSGNNLLFLPLDKLIQSTNPGQSPDNLGTVPPAASTVMPENINRSRDAFRNRDREERP